MMIPDSGLAEWGIIIAVFTSAAAALRVLVKLPAVMNQYLAARAAEEYRHAEELIATRQRDQALTELAALAPAVKRVILQFEPNGGRSLRDRVDYACVGVDEVKLAVETLGKHHDHYDTTLQSIVDWQASHDGRVASPA